jgi:hypothetical protein
VALTELERRRRARDLAKLMERRRPPSHVRSRLDLGYRISRQSVEIVETRPDRQRPEDVMEHPAAKAAFARTRNRWHAFRMRRALAWHGDEPNREARSLAAFLKVVDRDEYGRFFG